MERIKPNRRKNAGHRRAVRLWSALLTAALVAAAPLAARAETVSMKDVEAAVLREDWRRVVELLASVTDDPEKSPDPVLRLIKAHACLALNRNNESVCLLLSVQTPEDRERWLRWVEDFAARHSAIPIAHYCRGDALARSGRSDEAITCFTAAIDRTPGKQHALSFNARGVVYASRKEPRKARADFDFALTSSGHRLADAYANIGALRIESKEGAEAALRAFDRALAAQLSPKFALALHGRACVELVLRKNEAAKRDFELAEKYGGCALAMMERNRVRIVAYWRGVTESELLAAIKSGADAGTTLDSRLIATNNALQNYFAHPSQRAYNNFISQYGHLTPAQQQGVDNVIKSTLNDNPALASAFQRNNSVVRETNKTDGLAPFLTGVVATIPYAGLPATYLGNWTQQNYNSSNHFADLKPASAAGGLDMDLAKIAWEGGDWPFLAYYGLMFDKNVGNTPYARFTTTR